MYNGYPGHNVWAILDSVLNIYNIHSYVRVRVRVKLNSIIFENVRFIGSNLKSIN